MNCRNLRRRIANDRRLGAPTSPEAMQFVRKTCPCRECQAWRSKRKARA